MHSFRYFRPQDPTEAVRLIAEDQEAKYLAGGQTLLPSMKHRLAAPTGLIDLGRIAALRAIEKEDGALRIGAMARHFDVAASNLVRAVNPALADLAGMIGDPAVRHRGTLGGSIANNDPAADYPAACLALGAEIVTDQRTLSANDFFSGLFETALAESELIVAVRFPTPDKAAYQKFRHPASRYALTGVFVAVTQGTVTVAVTGAGVDGVFRWREAEDALVNTFSARAIAELRPEAVALAEDSFASAAYRAQLVSTMTMRAVEAAAEQPGPGHLTASKTTY